MISDDVRIYFPNGFRENPGRSVEWCLRCNDRVASSTFNFNNGVCSECEPLGKIAPEFWRVISKLGAEGDWNAQEALRKYA